MTFGTFLLKLRRYRSLSQKEMAAAIEVGQSTLCEWESDVCLPKTKYFPSLAEALNLKTAVLLQCVNDTEVATAVLLQCGNEATTEADSPQKLQAEIQHLRQRNQELQLLTDVLLKKLSSGDNTEGGSNLLIINTL